MTADLALVYEAPFNTHNAHAKFTINQICNHIFCYDSNKLIKVIVFGKNQQTVFAKYRKFIHIAQHPMIVTENSFIGIQHSEIKLFNSIYWLFYRLTTRTITY